MERTPDSDAEGKREPARPTPPADGSNPFAIAGPSSIPGDAYNTGQIARGLAALNTRTEFHPEWVGQFRILSVLGEGGMGVVYEAEQQRPRRIIALKVIRPQIVTKMMLKRFDMEVAALARLQHPSIAHVYEAGANETPIGLQPYLVMELVRGALLTAHVEQNKPDISARLELMAKVCDGVQYAHQRGVIHRDLKPANILVDETGQPKILDFGVAKLAADPRDGDTPIPSLQTEAGNLVGTLQYMSPEQASGLSGEVDTRTDIYALGLICYELLAGQRPYDLSRRHLPDAVRIIREDDPAPLSSVSRVFRGDVETIIAKALAKEKDRRYASAGALAADIRRYLRDEPIAARPPSATYQLAKFARRNKTLVFAAAATLLVLILGIITTTWQAMEARQRAREAAERKDDADALRTVAERNAQAYAAQANELRLLVGERSLQDAWSKVEAGDSWSGMLLMVRAMQLGPQDARWQEDRRIAIASVLEHVPRMTERVVLQEESPPTPADDRFFALHAALSADQSLAVTWENGTEVRLWDLHTGRLLRRFDHAGRVNDACFSNNANMLLTCSADGFGRIWKLGAGHEQTAAVMLQHSADVRRGAFSPTGARVATASADGTAKLWDPQSGHCTVLTGHNAPVDQVIFSDAGDLFATASRNGAIRVWSADNGTPKTAFMLGGGVIRTLAFDPPAKRLLAGYQDGTARVWNLATGDATTQVRHERAVTAAVFSPENDGARIATGSVDGSVQIWDAASGRAVGDRRQHNWSVSHLAFSRDGARLLTTSGDDAATVADLGFDQQTELLLPQGEGVCIAGFSRDGKAVTSLGWDRTVRRWSLPTNDTTTIPSPALAATTQPAAALPPTAVPSLTAVAATIAPARPSVVSSDGRWAAAGDPQGNVVLWDLSQPRQGTVLAKHAGAVNHVEISNDGRRLLSASSSGVVELRDLPPTDAASPPRTINHNRTLAFVRMNHDGSLVGTITSDFTARIWDGQTGQRLSLLGAEGSVRGIAFSPAAAKVAAVAIDGTVSVSDPLTGRPEISLHGAAGVTDAWFNADGRQIATAARDGVVRTWRSDNGEPISPPLRHPAEIRSISYSADGSRMLVVCYNGPARVWETATWRPLTRPISSATLAQAVLSADGRRVLLPGSDEITRIWDVATDQLLVVPLQNHQPISTAGFGDEGRRIVVIASRGDLQSWDLRPDQRPLADLQSLAELLAARKLDSTGAISRLSAPELQDRWTHLRLRYPEAFAAPATQPREPSSRPE